MAFKTTITARERMLLFGPPGSGKSTAILTIAKRCPESRVFVCDSDYSMERMLIGDYALANIEVLPSTDWDDLMENVVKAQGQMGADDWLSVDMVGPAWEMVQEWFTDKIFGKSIEMFFVEARQAQKKGSPFDGRKDWSVINKVYRKFAMQLLKTPGHLLCTSGVKAVSEEDEKTVRNLFGAYGVRPAGQKALAHDFHTVMLMSKTRVGEYLMTTVKDRQRPEVENAPVKDFSLDYLLKLGGWRPGQ